MKHGFIKTAAASPAVKIGQTEENAKLICECIDLAIEKGVKILVLPELCVTGAFGGDIYKNEDLLASAREAVVKIKEHTLGSDILVVLGAPCCVDSKLYSAMFFLQDGEIRGIIPGSAPHEPPFSYYNAETFYLDSYGAPFGPDIIFTERNLGLRISGELGSDSLQPITMGTETVLAGVQILCVSSAFGASAGSCDETRNDFSAYSRRLKAGLVVAGSCEISSVNVPSGQNLIAENGIILAESSPLSGSMVLSEVDYKMIDAERRNYPQFAYNADGGFPECDIFFGEAVTELTRTYDPEPFCPADGMRKERCGEIIAVQTKGLANRMKSSKTEKLVLGISGGLDSTLALLVSAYALDALGLPRTNLYAVSMPCFGTSQRTKTNAEKLCEGLGVTFKTIDIKEAVTGHLASLGHKGNADTAFENAQARERTQILFDLSNMIGGLVVGTGDLSETALGWCTYNGDHMSSFGVNATLPKTVIRHVVAYEAEKLPEIREYLFDVIDTPVSPELLPLKDGKMTQPTEAILGPYELHDFFIYYFVRFGMTRDKLKRMALSAFKNRAEDEITSALNTFFRRFSASAFKRNCSPDAVIALKPNLVSRSYYVSSDAKIPG